MPGTHGRQGGRPKTLTARRTESPAEADRRWSNIAFGLADSQCVRCEGKGLRISRQAKLEPCRCVLRAVFRACYAKYRYVQEIDPQCSQVTVDRINARGRNNGAKQTFGRRHEEFSADFCLVSRRTLEGEDLLWRIFELHMLGRRGWRECTRVLGIDKGSFFHGVYRVQERLGKVFRELQPYSLFPLDEYFGGTTRDGLAAEDASWCGAPVEVFPVANRRARYSAVRTWPGEMERAA